MVHFSQCPNIQYILIDSGNLLALPINTDAFKQNSELYYFWFRSYGGVTEIYLILVLTQNYNLMLEHNNFSGTLPNFGNNQSIHYVNINRNSFSGQIPVFTNLSNLRYLFLQNNSFASIGEPNNLPNLWYYYAHNNQLKGEKSRLYYLH